ncbi:hypothetical protein ES705_09427 [subsurface metagenome]
MAKTLKDNFDMDKFMAGRSPGGEKERNRGSAGSRNLTKDVFVKQGVLIRKDYLRRLKVLAAQSDTTMKEFLDQALEDFLKKSAEGL